MPNMRSFKRRLQHLRYPSGASACTQCSASSSSLPATTSSYATACQQPSSSSPVDNLIPLWACLGAIGALVLGVLIGWQCQPQHQGPEYGRTKPESHFISTAASRSVPVKLLQLSKTYFITLGALILSHEGTEV